MGHSLHGHGPNPAPGGSPTRTHRLGWVLALTAGYTLAEVAGGLLANSLALLADAGHMMTDNLALGLALLAAWTSRRPPDPARTYGYKRVEILAALVNSVALVVISLLIFWEAWERFRDPRTVDGPLMALVATGGLLVNVAAIRILHGARGLNVRAAYLHVLGDLLASVGTLAAAGLIAWRGWSWVDPLASVVVAAIIIVSSTRLVTASVHVLLEGVPAHLDAREVQQCLMDTPGVSDVHDLHLWSLAGGTPLLTAHLVIDHTVPPGEVLREATDELARRFGITHVTLQVEPPDFNIVDAVSTGPGARRAGPS